MPARSSRSSRAWARADASCLRSSAVSAPSRRRSVSARSATSRAVVSRATASSRASTAAVRACATERKRERRERAPADRYFFPGRPKALTSRRLVSSASVSAAAFLSRSRSPAVSVASAARERCSAAISRRASARRCDSSARRRSSCARPRVSEGQRSERLGFTPRNGEQRADLITHLGDALLVKLLQPLNLMPRLVAGVRGVRASVDRRGGPRFARSEPALDIGCHGVGTRVS